jgi:hypothetical protein
MASYGIDEVPDYFQPILERIEELFDAWLVVDDYDDEWVQFHVPRVVDQSAIAAIQKNNQRILIGDEQKTFQILCPWSVAQGKGLCLHCLADTLAQVEYRAGVWFY